MVKILPQCFRQKHIGIHKAINFGGEWFIHIYPFVRYRFNGVEFVTTDSSNWSPILKHIGYCRYREDLIIEVFNFIQNKWNVIDTSADQVVNCFFAYDMEELENNYAGYYSIELHHGKGFIDFDVAKWIQDRISIEIDVDMQYGRSFIFPKGMENKKIKSETISDWDASWRSLDDLNIIFPTLSHLNNFIQELESELKEIKLTSNYRSIYDRVKNGELSYEEFIKEI